jgi:pimeloyl-ACP methyl ester carboxylesterase
VEISQRLVDINGIRMHVVEAGSGPLVVLLHGFPELSYSYRHQIEPLAQAGYHVVAPDLRGYGQTDAPVDPSQYTQLHLVGDVVGLIQALDASEAVVVGHDWGSPLASNVSLFRPDLVRGVVLLSVPYMPRGEVDAITGMERAMGADNYQSYFQTNAAQVELEKDVRRTLFTTLVGMSGDNPEPPRGMSARGGFLAMMDDLPDEFPNWLTEADLDHYSSHFARTGFLGGLNWYRAARLNWELMAPWHRAPLPAPALFVGGARDPVLAWPGLRTYIERMDALIPRLQRSVILDGCGHWIQQERPERTNELLLEFLEVLPGPRA